MASISEKEAKKAQVAITCKDVGIYIVTCKKDSGRYQQVHPTYIGECVDGEESSFTHRVATHLGSVTQRSQADTIKPVGRHFRLPGHTPQDLVMLPIEKISDAFRRKAREAYYINKFATLKRLTVNEIEHSLNLSPGQTYLRLIHRHVFFLAPTSEEPYNW